MISLLLKRIHNAILAPARDKEIMRQAKSEYKKDWEHALKFSHKETLIVIDNIWDIRLKEVRRFYDDMTTNKWDFEEWNDANRTMVQDTGVLLTY